MVELLNFAEEARQIELEIERLGVALGIDWHNDVQVRSLARDALHHKGGSHGPTARRAVHSPKELAKEKLFGLAGLMLRTMKDSADHGIHTHGGPAWKAFGRALYIESGAATPQ